MRYSRFLLFLFHLSDENKGEAKKQKRISSDKKTPIKNRKTKGFSMNMPSETHKKLKILAIKKGQLMADVILQQIKKII